MPGSKAYSTVSCKNRLLNGFGENIKAVIAKFVVLVE
jgi:hypothetical protein